MTLKRYFDDDGRLRWVKDGEGHITYLAQHPDSGEAAYRMTDVETDDLPTDITAGSTGKWIEWDDGSGGDTIPSGFANTANDNLQLVTKSEFDALGRPRKQTDPAGMVTYTAYQDNQTLTFRAWDAPGSKPLLPIEVVEVNDADDVTERYTVTMILRLNSSATASTLSRSRSSG